MSRSRVLVLLAIAVAVAGCGRPAAVDAVGERHAPGSATSTTSSTTTTEVHTGVDSNDRSTTTTTTRKRTTDTRPRTTATVPRTTTTAKAPRTTTTTAPRVTTTAPPVGRPDPSAGPAPIGGARGATWWTPAPDRFSTDMVWFFDPSREQRPYGWQQTFQPSGGIVPVKLQHNFTWAKAGAHSVQLLHPTGTRQVLEVLSYDPQADVARVTWEGTAQTWYGCRSGKMPAKALAACRA